jgi:hypothetical protein
MGESAFAELAGAPANCRCADAADRGTAGRLLFGSRAAPEYPLPDSSTVSVPGRVHSLGRFTSDELRTALAAALPPALRDSLRREFEWYACRGAFFHTDAHYGAVLFGAWCVAGPRREIIFARHGARVPAAPGDWVVFDPFEPHAVLDAGMNRYERKHYEGEPPSLFIGFELELDERVRRAFCIGTARTGAPLLASSVAVNAESGALD